MAIDSVAGLVEALRQYHLLEPAQLDELAGPLHTRFTEARGLARELIQRGWLTPYQINQLLQGRGADLILGSYVLLERLGEGGMGQVFKARHQKLGRVVALKVIRKDRVANAEARKRFHREIQAASQLAHPNVVMAYDADQAGDQHFFAMEYVEGTDLSKWVKDHGPLPVRDACQYVREAALGLQHAHERGLVHRDIKPSNLILTLEGKKGDAETNGPRVKLMDLGLVALRGDDHEGATTLTQEGSVVGTPDYIAPEQARNAHRADIRADLYSLGCTFYFLLSGQPPFTGGTLTEKLLKHHWDAATPVEQLRPGVPPNVAAVVRRLMAKKPEERYQTPAELVQALDAALDPSRVTTDEPVTETLPVAVAVPTADSLTAVTAGAAPRYRRPAGRRRWLALGGAVAALGLLVVGLVALKSKAPAGADTPGLARVVTAPAADGPVALDKLRRAAIPAAELVSAGHGDSSRAPAGLVAVLGDSRLKHWNAVYWLAFSPDGKTLASASADGSARLWNAETGQLLRALNCPDAVTQVAFTGNGRRVVTICYDRTIRLWEAGSGKQLYSSFAPVTATATALSPDATRCAMVDNRNQVVIREVATGKDERTLRTVPAINRIAYRADGQGLAAACADGTLKVWELGQDEAPSSFGTQRGPIDCVAYSPDGKYLASGSNRDNTVKVWDAASHKEVQSFSLEGVPVVNLAFSPDSRQLLTTAGALWDVATGRAVHRLQSHGAAVLCVAFRPDGKVAATGGQDWLVKLWETESGREVSATGSSSGGRAVALSPDGKYLAWGGRDTHIHVWDAAAGREARTLPGAQGPVLSLAFSPDNRTLAAGITDGTVRLWDVTTDKAPQVFRGHQGPVVAIAFRPDGKALASAGGVDRSVRLWDVAAGTHQVVPLRTGGATAFCLAFAPDGKTLAVGYGSNFVHLWDLERQGERVLKGHGRDVLGVAFSADGKTLASVGGDGALKFWDAAAGTEQRTFVPGRTLLSVALSADGKAAVASDGGTVTLYDLGPRGEATTLTLGPANGFVPQVVFSPEGRHVITANSNGTVYILRLSEKK